MARELEGEWVMGWNFQRKHFDGIVPERIIVE